MYVIILPLDFATGNRGQKAYLESLQLSEVTKKVFEPNGLGEGMCQWMGESIEEGGSKGDPIGEVKRHARS